MASVIDAFRETYSDRFSFLKIFILAIPVYCSYQLYLQSKGDSSNFLVVAGITAFFLFGFLTEIIGNIINERDYILPSLNPLKLAFTSVKAILSVGIYALIASLAANYFCSLIHIIPWLDITLKTIIWFVVASVLVSALLMFSAKGKILDAYKLKVLSEKSGDLVAVLIIFIIQLVVINIPTIIFVGYVLIVLFGIGVIFNIFASLAFVFNLAIVGHYLGQVYYEYFDYKKGARF